MAIDGVEIIDSDYAHDLYNEFMDLYDSNVEIPNIIARLNNSNGDFFDVIDEEIFLTVMCLALWEVGYETDPYRKNLIELIESNRSLKEWVEITDLDSMKEREKVLKKLVAKTASSRKTPRKRKKYPKISKFIFNEDDLVVYQTKDGLFQAMLLYEIFQHKSQCLYLFSQTDYKGLKKPKPQDIKNLLVHRIGDMSSKVALLSKQPNLKKFWKENRDFEMLFSVGLVTDSIDHKELLKFSDKLEVVGQIKLYPGYKKTGAIGGVSTFEELLERQKDFENRRGIFKYIPGPLKRMKN